MRWLRLLGWASAILLAQPPNDNCANGIFIPFGSAPYYATGTYTSTTVDITNATLQTGEYVPPGVPNGKTVWYRFYIPTTRTVKIVLKQVGNSINPAHAGWTLYRGTNCLPTAADRVDPPIVLMEGYTHACLRRGWYMVQVGANLAASGQIFLEIELSAPLISAGAEAHFDHMANAQNLGILSTSAAHVMLKNVTFEFACQSVFPGEAICDNDSSWSKSSWHVFLTDNHIDWLGIELMEDPWNTNNTSPREWRLFIYQGNAVVDSANLTLIQGCIPMTQSNSALPARYDRLCQLQPNTYYSIKIMARTNYSGTLRLRLYERGSQPAVSINPLSIPASHQLGSLSVGPTYTISNHWSCQSRISSNPCNTFTTNITPDDTINGYDLAFYYTFTLTNAANVRFWYSHPWSWWYCMDSVRFRIFEGTPSVNGCNLTLKAAVNNDAWVNCLPAGTYTVQVLGRINRSNLWTTCAWPNSSALGLPINVHVQLGSLTPQKFALHNRPQEADSINNGVPLAPNVTYTSQRDTLDCQTTILPAGSVCGSGNNRAIYRIIKINQNGILEVGGGNWLNFSYRLYKGDARIEPIVGGLIQNLVDQVGCQSLFYPFKVCVTPGTYTLVSFGDDMDIGASDQPWVRLHVFPPGERRFYTPTGPVHATSDPDPRPNVENVGTIGGSVHSLTATWTRITCDDNPLTIMGHAPCGGATKQFYWEVYIAEPSLITFSPQYTYIGYEVAITGWRTFQGRISNSSLTALYKDCHWGFTECMDPGWYTFVAYATGQTYSSPTYTSGIGRAIGNTVWFTISRNPNVQKYGTFATANNLGTRDWISQYTYAPKQDTTYVLDWEYWGCSNNLPFPSGITPCQPNHNRISYRVFAITKPSYVVIFQSGCHGASRLYSGNITTSSPPYSIVQDCFSGTMRICWLPPGTYTLVTFANNSCIGQTFTPSIYVDSVGVSQRNYAINAYDFGTLPADNTEYKGNPGDPLGPYGRPPSTDFIFCTTDAAPSDPISNCPLGVQNNTPPSATPPAALPDRRRNLWYTFVANGNVKIHVTLYVQTPGALPVAFSVYESDDDPPGPFPANIDSTTAQGLTLVASSQGWWCCSQSPSVSFTRDACKGPRRYYIVVERNTCGKEPNIQVEVGVKIEPLPGGGVSYNHYSQANVITGNPTTQCGLPYTWAALPAGTYTGCQGDMTCATKDPTDQNACGTKTIWYAFESNITGYVYLNYDRPGHGQYYYNHNDIQLYYQAVPGDSSSTGLVPISMTGMWQTHPDHGNVYWGRSCVRPGRYYIMFTGCTHDGLVVPRIWLVEHKGDFCHDSLTIAISGPGGPHTANLFINCFTIGEGAGESDTTMACFGTPVGKKSAWVLIQNNSTDTLNFDVQIVENTTALGDQVLYRVLTGNCNTMNQEECVAEGTYVTLNLKCRPPLKSFWVQIVLPEWATGDINVNVTAHAISQPCIPPDPDKPRANFDFVGSCLGQPTQFLNYSSIGPGIQYYWIFGDNSTSTLFQPQHTFAVADTYKVCLGVSNGVHSDTACRFLIIYPNPSASISVTPSSPVLTGTPITFTPTYTDTVPGTGPTIYWNFCAGVPPCGASQTDHLGPVPPPVIYSAPGTKKVCVTISNGGICDTTICVEFEIIIPHLSGGPYDGAATQVVLGNCPFPVFLGGPHDGAATQVITSNCVISSFPGGPFDGAATAFIESVCWLSSYYTGGPYDGAAVASLINCPPPDGIVLKGGPFDGAASQVVLGNCPLPNFAGGPFDGAASQVVLGSCPLPNFAGGPFDGAATQILLGNCTVIISGGPYDGAATAYWSTFSAKDTAVCVGSPVTLNVGTPSSWYLVPTGGTPVASNTSTMSIPALNQSQLYWVDNGCLSSRAPVAAIALAKLNAQLSVSPVPYCANAPVTFTNQTLVSGASQPSFGSLITTFGTHSTVPNNGQLTFSSVQTANFSHLGDGVHQNGTAWTANNTGAGTQWAMWRYPIPRSVNRIVFWACQTCINAAQLIPLRARLYYHTGSGWNLAKTFTFLPGNFLYDSGIFTETQAIFAQLWRLDFDVAAANAPSFGEFQVYSSSPVIGGTVQWSCDGGVTWNSGSSQSCTWSTPGTKTIKMVVNAPSACPDTATATVNITDCGPLPSVQSILAAYPTPQAHARLLWQTNIPIQYAILEKQTDTGWTAIYRHEVQGATGFTWLDSFPTFDGVNLYRVVSEHGIGQLVYSNLAEVRFAAEGIEEFVRAFPNPLTDLLTVQFSVSSERQVAFRIYDVKGAIVGYLTPESYAPGLYEVKLDVRNWATGVYTLQFMKDNEEHSVKLLKITP